MSDDDIEMTDYQALAEFRTSIRRFLHFSEQAARAAGLEPQQHQLLLAVKGLPDDLEPTVGELADRLQLQHHSTVELINRLEQRGLVTRVRGESDRRQVFIHVTDEGERLLRELSFTHRAELRSAGPALVRALDTIVGSIRNNQARGRGSNS